MLLNFHVKTSVCFILFAAEGLRGWKGHRGSLRWGSQVQEKEEKEEKSRRGGSSWISGKEKKHKALRIMNEAALFLLAHIHIVYTLSFIWLKAASAAPQEPPTLSSKKQQSSSISSSSQSELDFWLSCILSREPPDLQTLYAVFCSSSFFFQ